ncbi:MAG: hypothetical protein ACK5BQ_03895 [Ignavibacteria bacterium]|jgi:hypothetical protein
MNDLYKSLNLQPYCSVELVRVAIEHRNDPIAQRARDILLDPVKKKAYDHAHYATARIVGIRRSLGLLNTDHWDNSRYRDWNPVARDPRSADGKAHRAESTNVDSQKRKLEEAGAKVFRGFVVLAIMAIIYGSCMNRSRERTSNSQSSRPGTSAYSDNYSPSMPTTAANRPERVAGGDLNALPRPRHNKLFKSKGSAVSHLTVRSSEGSDYYIKLVDVVSRKTIRSAYIHGGKVGEIPVPLGEYYLYWSNGTDWYGPKFGFGKDAPKQKGSTTFNFERNGNRIHGWAVTLYTVPNGNMSQESVDDSDFDRLDD